MRRPSVKGPPVASGNRTFIDRGLPKPNSRECLSMPAHVMQGKRDGPMLRNSVCRQRSGCYRYNLFPLAVVRVTADPRGNAAGGGRLPGLTAA